MGCGIARFVPQIAAQWWHRDLLLMQQTNKCNNYHSVSYTSLEVHVLVRSGCGNILFRCLCVSVPDSGFWHLWYNLVVGFCLRTWTWMGGARPGWQCLDSGWEEQSNLILSPPTVHSCDISHCAVLLIFCLHQVVDTRYRLMPAATIEFQFSHFFLETQTRPNLPSESRPCLAASKSRPSCDSGKIYPDGFVCIFI